MASLRHRITLGMVGIASGVVLIAAVGTWFVARSFIFHGIDRELENLAEPARRLEISAPILKPNREQRWDQRRMLQVVTPRGEEVLRSNALGEGESLADPELPLDVPISRLLSTGRLVRILAIGMPESQQRIYLAMDLDTPNLELVRLAWVLAGLWLAASVLAWLGATLIEPLLLLPLRRLCEAIDHIGPEDLAGRLPDTAGPDEVRGLVDRLNHLLARLDGAFRREQTTIAHIAHELRTPVTVLRTALEFRLLAARDPAETTVLQACFRTVERMQTVVSNLLLLARLEAGTVELASEPVELADLVAEQVVLWESQAQARGQRFAVMVAQDRKLNTAPAHLRQILENLFGNAVAHSAPGTTITISGDDRELVIANPCTEVIDPEQLGRVFYRADSARSAGDHAGLGLALCRRLALLLGNRLELGLTAGEFRACLVFADPVPAVVSEHAPG
jgi:signal transduction histidine kinase